jgi:ATP-dependent Clp protease ATP-binding subunit ClpC
MADKFTQRTRRIMMLANDIALRHGLGSITELTLLIAVIEEGNGIAATILGACGMELGPLYRHLPATQTDLSIRSLMQPLQLSPECQRMLETAEYVVAEYGATQVGTEHLLVAMVRSDGTLAAKLLADAGVTEARIRETASQFA